VSSLGIDDEPADHRGTDDQMTIARRITRTATRIVAEAAGRFVQPYRTARTVVGLAARTDRYRLRPRRTVTPPCRWTATGTARTSSFVEQLADVPTAHGEPANAVIRPAAVDGLLEIESSLSGGGRAVHVMVDTPRIGPVFFPQMGRGVVRMAAADRRVSARTIRRLQRRSRVVLTPSATPSGAFAQCAVDLAAAGVPLEFGTAPEHRPDLIGARTFEAICAPPARGPMERELRSVRLRRTAMSDHGPVEALTHLCAPGAPTALRPVSVLLSTCRPSDLAHALRQVERQVGCRVQLLLGLHGEDWDGFDPEHLSPAVDDLVVQRIDGSVPLGDVLTALTTRADGDIVTKWDDDDWYGPDHLLDLLLAYDYSGADIVGKAAEFVYLEDRGETIRRSVFGAESYVWNLAGGTILTSKRWILDRGGWPSVPRHVDRLFLDASRSAGGSAYRTHGFQYVLRRRGDGSGHTWHAPDSYFAGTAASSRRGLDLSFADISPDPEFAP
jgi:hypothetical protein